jgi:hypothetical protein
MKGLTDKALLHRAHFLSITLQGDGIVTLGKEWEMKQQKLEREF